MWMRKNISYVSRIRKKKVMKDMKDNEFYYYFFYPKQHYI